MVHISFYPRRTMSHCPWMKTKSRSLIRQRIHTHAITHLVTIMLVEGREAMCF